jgi:hypothetical protein
MATDRAVCTNANCHHDLSGCLPAPPFCPACAAPVITICPMCGKSLGELKDPWAPLCEVCGARLRFPASSAYYGVM